MRRVPVESSCIDSVGYESEVLEVRFDNGGVYRYFEVPVQLYRQLLAAESKGRFFNAHVRDDYGYVRVQKGSRISPGEPLDPGRRSSYLLGDAPSHS